MVGLLAQRKSGHFGRTWWGKQVERILEQPLREGNKTVRHPVIARARALARNGAVLALEMQGGAVAGEVSGSQLEPFSPLITFPPISEDVQQQLREVIARHPGSAEQIISGILPEFLEPILEFAADQLHCECSCPRTQGRCAHVLALGCLLVERLDRDPHSYLTVRGVDLSEILVDKSTDPIAPNSDVSENLQPPEHTPWRNKNSENHTEDSTKTAKTTGKRGLDPIAYWELSGELPPLPTPTPEPAYQQLDAVQWMTVASSISPDPVEKLTLESDLRDAWQHLCKQQPGSQSMDTQQSEPSADSAHQDNRGEEE
ncbi:MAG TPA: hypothetical protein GX530_01405 [Corynebacteriales bacterium]|nr:hypothetical protein [Mycobacteriales bacterium]